MLARSRLAHVPRALSARTTHGALRTPRTCVHRFVLIRTLRAFRVFRLFKRIEALNKIVKMIGAAVPGVAAALAVLIISLSFYALVGVELFAYRCASSWWLR